MVIYPHFIPNFENYMVMYPYLTPNMETTRGSTPILFTILWTTWEYNPQDISKIGNNMGKHSQDFPVLGYIVKWNLFPRKNPFVYSCEASTSQYFPMQGISCPRFFTVVGKSPIKFPNGNLKKFPVCEVNTGYLIAETAIIPCIVLFSDILILFLAYQEIISSVF